MLKAHQKALDSILLIPSYRRHVMDAVHSTMNLEQACRWIWIWLPPQSPSGVKFSKAAIYDIVRELRKQKKGRGK